MSKYVIQFVETVFHSVEVEASSKDEAWDYAVYNYTGDPTQWKKDEGLDVTVEYSDLEPLNFVE